MKSKNLFFGIAILVATTFNTFATIRYVNNSAPTPTGTNHYSTVTAALAVTNAGDTINLEGSPVNYGSFTVPIACVIIGAGHNSQNLPPLSTAVGSITISGSNVTITGLRAVTVVLTSNAGGVTIRRCYINDQLTAASGTYTNITVEGCYINGSNANDFAMNLGNYNFSNLLIRNNVIRGYLFNVNGVSNVTSLVLNNVFVYTSTNYAIRDCANLTVNNNIFHVQPSNFGSTAVLYNKNICWANYGFLNGTNQSNIDPQYVAFPTLTAAFSYAANFQLSGTSPGKGYGTDATDVGVYGGIGQQYTYNQNGEPAIPLVRKLEITNPTVQSGTDLNVNFITVVKQ